mgnify:CR=1 FL=1
MEKQRYKVAIIFSILYHTATSTRRKRKATTRWYTVTSKKPDAAARTALKRLAKDDSCPNIPIVHVVMVHAGTDMSLDYVMNDDEATTTLKAYQQKVRS